MTALEVVGFRSTNPGAAGAAPTVNSGDSFTVRSFPFDSSAAWLENAWVQEATAAFLRITSPRLHDNVQGLRLRPVAAAARALLADEVRQRLYPQDTLSLLLAGGAAETDAGALFLNYEELPGVTQRLGTWAGIKPRVNNILTQEVSTTTSATVGDWPAGSALNATFDQLKPNVDYALLGYTVDTQITSLCVRGTETGNLRVGGPGTTEAIETRDWFISLGNAIQAPSIPVFNAASRANASVFAQGTQNAATVLVELILAELAPGGLA